MKKTRLIKLKAGALQYTIFIAVIIALLLFAFISLTYTQQIFKAKTIHFLKSIHNSNTAVNYTSSIKLPYNETIEKQFLEELNDLTIIEKRQWGIFDLVMTTSTIKKEVFTKNALLGGFLNSRPSLYLQDNNQALVLVGNTRVEGNVYLPKQGVKRGSIAGHSYLGSQLIFGDTYISEGSLPQINNKDYLQRLSQGRVEIENITPLELYENTSVLNEFSNPVQIFLSDDLIDLRDIKLTGHIIIQSRTAIKVRASAELTDIILIAPKIEILDNVTGNFQAIASNKISVAKNCTLIYPTSLIVYESTSPISNQSEVIKEINQIQIQSGSEIRGVVAFLSDKTIRNYKPQIILEENTTVFGEVYCSQKIELKGTVKGSVFTKGFIANQFGSIYQNHIYNGKILNAGFPKEYCGLSVEGSIKKVAKWLY